MCLRISIGLMKGLSRSTIIWFGKPIGFTGWIDTGLGARILIGSRADDA